MINITKEQTPVEIEFKTHICRFFVDRYLVFQ